LKLKFIDIHTHNLLKTGFSLINIFPEDVEKIKNDKFYSVGIHPWNVSKVNLEKQLSIVKKSASLKNVLAVGEIGADKLHPDFILQKEVFVKQLNIAKQLKKPAIIHCVKAYSDLLEILKKEKPEIPVIIHRYSGNSTTAGELLKFNCYFSFGHELFNEKSKVPKVFKKIPLETVFLETDDAAKDIKEIYMKAAELKEISLEKIKLTIFENFQKCFKINA